MVVDINNVSDLDILKQKVLEGEKIEIGSFRLSDCLIKLSNGRFSHYKVGTFDEEMANIVIEYQKSYRKFLKELKKELDLTIPIPDEKITFSISSGSVEFFSDDIFSFLKEAINNMESKHKAFVASILIGAFVGGYCWSEFMEYEKQELISKERNNNSETTKQLIQSVEKIALNKNLEQITNGYKKAIIEQLEDNETISFGRQETFSNRDSSRFDSSGEAEEQEIEEIEDREIILLSYNFRDKIFKAEGIRNGINSDVLAVEKRIKLISFAENGQKVKLRLKFIKNQDNKIKKIYILDYAS